MLILSGAGQQVILRGGLGPGYGVYTVTLDGAASSFSAARTTFNPSAELFRASNLDPAVLHSLFIMHDGEEGELLSVDQVRVAFE